MKNSKVDICFIGNAIVDILSKISYESLNNLKIHKGSMSLVDEESSDEILKYIQNPSIISGGSAANTAVGFKSFGGKCSFIGQIGKDKYGDLFSKDLNNSGVFFQDKDYLPQEKTSKCIVLITPDAERSMITYLGASNKFNINSLDKESKNIVELYEISNMKVQFFEDLLKQLKLNRNLKIIELKSKLKKENSLN